MLSGRRRPATRARRIAEETNELRDVARSLASGLGSELTIVFDSMLPMQRVVEALRAFTANIPTVPPRVYVQLLGVAVEMVLDGTCMLGLLPFIAGRDFGVPSGRTWRLADLGAKKSMLLAGLGWGNLSAHLVVDDIVRGC